MRQPWSRWPASLSFLILRLAQRRPRQRIQSARLENSFAHKWRVGDVLMWDNRSTMHRRDTFDAGARRIMHRTQIKGHHKPRAVG